MKTFIIIVITFLFSAMWYNDFVKMVTSKTKKAWWLHFVGLVLDIGFIIGWIYLGNNYLCSVI